MGKILSENRKARFDYEILEKFEAGISLTGSEVKSIRNGKVSLQESFIRPDNGNLSIIGMEITQYSHNASRDYDPRRKRQLLLHRKEIDNLRAQVERKGLTIVPLKLLLKKGWIKLEIALARGKSNPDKRETIKRREAEREAQRAMKR